MQERRDVGLNRHAAFKVRTIAPSLKPAQRPNKPGFLTALYQLVNSWLWNDSRILAVCQCVSKSFRTFHYLPAGLIPFAPQSSTSFLWPITLSRPPAAGPPTASTVEYVLLPTTTDFRIPRHPATILGLMTWKPWAFFMVALAGWMNRQQQARPTTCWHEDSEGVDYSKRDEIGRFGVKSLAISASSR